MTHDEGACIAYIDFCGRAGYIAQLFKTKEKCVALEVAGIMMIKSLLVEVDILRWTSLDFHRWKSTIIKISNLVSLANKNQQNKYFLSDISTGIVTPRQPSPRPPTLKPARVFMSLSKNGKRTRTVLEQGAKDKYTHKYAACLIYLYQFNKTHSLLSCSKSLSLQISFGSWMSMITQGLIASI